MTQPEQIMPPVFETARLILRPVTLDDAPSYTRHFVDYEVIGVLSRVVPWPYPDNGVADYLQNEVLPRQGINRWVWALCEKETPGTAIGAVDLWRPGRPENRGFWLGRAFWGRGYMTEAVEPVMDFAFGPLGFEQVILANAVGNVGSRRVKEKNGARLLYVEPASFVNSAYTEHEVWELTREAWQNRPR